MGNSKYILCYAVMQQERTSPYTVFPSVLISVMM